jgi:8-oxo-dGTP pyrophosphatase MutT (NUDIX family)
LSRHRLAVRVLLRSKSDRILLFLSHFEPGSGLEPAWVFPGGGVEQGESLNEAATRELFEETGREFHGSDLSDLLESVQHVMPDKREFETGEAHFFELRLEDEFEPDSKNWTQDEHRDNVTHRWWSLEEILKEFPWIEPAGSIDVLKRHL